jgi:hypothetical protein
MKSINSLTAFGVVLLAVVLIGNVCWVTAQSKTGGSPDNSSTAQTAPRQEPTPAKKEDAQQTKPTETGRGKDANDQVVNKLQELAVKLQSELQINEKALRTAKIMALREDQRNEIELQTIQSVYQFERELLLAEIRDKVRQVHTAGLSVVNENAIRIPDDRSNARLKELFERAVKDLETSKESLKKLDQRYLNEIALHTGRGIPAGDQKDIDSLEQSCKATREQLSMVNRQLILAKMRQLGVQESSAVEDINYKLDQLNQEIRDLRKELQALKKQK